MILYMHIQEQPIGDNPLGTNFDVNRTEQNRTYTFFHSGVTNTYEDKQ